MIAAVLLIATLAPVMDGTIATVLSVAVVAGVLLLMTRVSRIPALRRLAPWTPQLSTNNEPPPTRHTNAPSEAVWESAVA